MLEFVIFAVTFAVFLIALVIYLSPSRSKASSIPGMPQSDPKEGNLSDISTAGNVNEFLIKLHEEYGPIASFWIGPQMAVSLASPVYFEENKHAFDRSNEFFEVYKPFFGENSTMYCNGQVARIRRKILIQSLDMLMKNNSKNVLTEFCDELSNKWSSLDAEEHIPLWNYMKAFCLKCSLNILFGSELFDDDKEMIEFSRYLEQCFSALELQESEAAADIGMSQKKRLDKVSQKVHNSLTNYVKNCRFKKVKNTSVFLETFLESDLSDEIIVDDLKTCLYYYYSISSLLCWALYFISMHSEVQDKIITEIKKGRKESKKYFSMVMKETLRISPVFPWTTRKQVDVDTVIGGHIVPKNTIIIHALSVVMSSEEYWTLPKMFNPDRFCEKSLNKLIYAPFGFAGNRKCPAEEFITEKFNLFLFEICKKFILKPVDDQVAVPLFRSITRPADEIWITLEKRPPFQ